MVRPLGFLSNTPYFNKEIFLRTLIYSALDAMDKFRCEPFTPSYSLRSWPAGALPPAGRSWPAGALPPRTFPDKETTTQETTTQETNHVKQLTFHIGAGTRATISSKLREMSVIHDLCWKGDKVQVHTLVTADVGPMIEKALRDLVPDYDRYRIHRVDNDHFR